MMTLIIKKKPLKRYALIHCHSTSSIQSKETSMLQKQKTPIQLALLFSSAAWAAAFYALWHQTSLLSGASSESAFCNINSYISCDNVALSPYSNLLGLPVASFAMAFFACFLVLAILLYFAELDRNTDLSKNLSKWLFWGALASFPVTLIYAGISLFVIKSLCLSCTGIYLLHLGLLILTYKIKKNCDQQDGSSTLPLFSFSSGTLGLFAGVAVLNLLTPKFLESSFRSGPTIEDSSLGLYVAQHLANPQYYFKTENSPSIGNEKAPVTIVVFSDYQCPYCKLASNILPTVAKSFGDKVRLVSKDFPLNSECNPGMSNTGHPYSCQAAKIAKCVYNSFGSEAYHKLSKSLFSKQEQLGTDTIKALAIEAGLTSSQVSDCLSNLTIHESIVADVTEGMAAKVESTPSVFVNGRKLEAAINPQILRLTIEHYLK